MMEYRFVVGGHIVSAVIIQPFPVHLYTWLGSATLQTVRSSASQKRAHNKKFSSLHFARYFDVPLQNKPF